MTAEVVKLRAGQPDDEPAMTEAEATDYWRVYGKGWSDCAEAADQATFDAGYMAGIQMMLDLEAERTAHATPPTRRRRSASTADLSLVAS